MSQPEIQEEGYSKAHAQILGLEGTYSNDPVDPGGETFAGISRRFHPSWEGWPIVDRLRHDIRFPYTAVQHPELKRLVEKFYKERYWDAFALDEFPYPVAFQVFQMAVNLGKERTTRYIQRVVNVLNRNGHIHPDLVVDGRWGPNTFRAMRHLLDFGNGPGKLLVVGLRALQAAYYIRRIEQNPSQERFAWGWLRRAFRGAES